MSNYIQVNEDCLITCSSCDAIVSIKEMKVAISSVDDEVIGYCPACTKEMIKDYEERENDIWTFSDGSKGLIK